MATRSARADRMQRKPKPLPKGAVVARCIDCHGLALADGKGSPAVIKHADECPNRAPACPEPAREDH